MEQNRNILLLDNDEKSALDILRFLKVSAYAFSVSHASDVSEGMNYIKTRKPDLVLLDANIIAQKDFSGLSQLTHAGNIPVILLSDMSEQETRNQSEKAGATDYIVKNKINLFHLQKSIANTLKLSEVEAKSDNTVSKLASQNEALHLLLNRVNTGVVVLNENNTQLYSNEKAYIIISDSKWRTVIDAYLSFREIEHKETIEFKSAKNETLRVTSELHKWNNEKAMVFVLEEVKSQVQLPNFSENESAIALLNAVRDNVLLLQNSQIVFANKNALQLLKGLAIEVTGKTFSSVFEGAQLPEQNLLISQHFQPVDSTCFLKQPDGQLISTWLNIQPILLNKTMHYLVLFRLVVKDDEQIIPGARSEDDRFSSEGVLHLASHDLREPVRTILNYVQLISENLRNKKYDEATEYANFAKDAAGRMEKLLSDLKTYIGLNEHKFTLSKISLKTSLADVLRQLKPRLEEAGAEVSFSELPVVSADRELTEKLLFHLIDNAIKFRKGDKKPVIDIGYDKFEGNTIFCVRDNGIGISRKYYSKIFNLFERLNRVDEFPGNGLGLPICKKIIEMHGGEIWVESLPGSGSNFYFTLKGK